MSDEYDVITIGGGPGGYAAALYAASAGLRVALVESDRLGGTCLNRGCIPAKQLLETAAAYVHARAAGALGIRVSGIELDWTAAMRRKEHTVADLVGGLAGLLAGRQITVFNGIGRLRADRHVSVSSGSARTIELTANAVVLAPGSVPRTIPALPIDGVRVLTSDELLSIPSLPDRMVIIGGGAVGCECASLFADAGTKVTVVEALPSILPGLDAAVRGVLEQSFARRGVEIHAGAAVRSASLADCITLDVGDTRIDADVAVVTVGRRPNTTTLDLTDTAIVIDANGYVAVDERCRTGEAGVWAVGDSIATPALAHVAFLEGMLAVRDILGEEPDPIEYGKVPWCIYTRPEVAYVGLSEDAAVAAGFEVVTANSHHSHNGRAMITGATDGLVKVVAERLPDGSAGTILGIHMAGPWVTEQIGQAALAVNWDASVADLTRLVQPHPTLTEVLGEALLTLSGRRLHG